MRRVEIETIVRSLAQGELHTPPAAVEATIDRLDSLERMQLAMVIEDRFQILLQPEDEAGMASLDDLVILIERKLAER